MIAKVKATPQNILPAASTAATCTIGPSLPKQKYYFYTYFSLPMF